MVFEGLDVSVGGLGAQRIRMDLVSSNLANVNSSNGENGEPYRRKVPVFEAVLDSESSSLSDEKHLPLTKVRVKDIAEDPTPFKLKYEPSHPDADENGYINLPNIDPMKEMVDMISAMRSYEANLTAFNTHKDMLLKALEIVRA